MVEATSQARAGGQPQPQQPPPQQLPEPAPPSSSTTSSTSSTSAHLPFPKDCRACAGAQHMLDTFRHMALGGRAKHASTTAVPSSSTSTTSSAGTSSSAAPAPAAGQHQGPPRAMSSSHAEAETEPEQWERQCPPDTAELGRATWTFLHSVAAYYPDQPSRAQQSLMRSMLDGLAEFYPCTFCRAHYQNQVDAAPPDTSSRLALSLWLCRRHNEVNEMLGRPEFDCAKVLERWKDGPADGSCD